ncbi:MAG: NiFe hydrogenase, partial [Candidatus Omnitrophica bacterium]|nr:NiFe hydrogenase [Candidatus Omnitrophota bacterium]
GGIPKGEPNPTGAMGVKEFLEELGIGKTVINIPGCPAHPDWIIGTLIHIIFYGMPELDFLYRPKLFFGKTIHESCSRYYYFSENRFASSLGEEGCLINLGCRGPYTRADCPLRAWNNGVNWCVESGGMCVGCCSPNFPDGFSPIYSALPQEFFLSQESIIKVCR